MPGYKRKRKTIIVKPEFQIRLAFWGSIITVAEVVVGCMIVMLVAMTNANLSPGDQVDFFYKIILIIAGLVLVMTGINFVITILFSHRIAGPVYRLQQSMEKVGKGDLSLLINLRSGDELHELKDSFNDMVSSLREKVKGIHATVSGIKQNTVKKKITKKAVGKKSKAQNPAADPGQMEWPFKLD